MRWAISVSYSTLELGAEGTGALDSTAVEGRSTAIAFGFCIPGTGVAVEGKLGEGVGIAPMGVGETLRGTGCKSVLGTVDAAESWGGAIGVDSAAAGEGDIDCDVAGGGDPAAGANAEGAAVGEAADGSETFGLKRNLTTPGAAPEGVDGVPLGNGKGDAVEVTAGEADERGEAEAVAGGESVTDSFNVALPVGVPVGAVEAEEMVAIGEDMPT